MFVLVVLASGVEVEDGGVVVAVGTEDVDADADAEVDAIFQDP